MIETKSIAPTLVVITGPTGSGKTDLSVVVAKHFNAPILSCDSRQIYKGLTIGTAQPSVEQLKEVEHYFIATQEITEHYTAGKYEKDALELLEKLFTSHPVVVMVGGSGLYVNAVCEGMDNLPKRDPKLREELIERMESNGLDDLLTELKQRDLEYYSQVDRSNPNRVIRALEVCILANQPYSALRKGEKTKRNFNIVKLATNLPREELYERINQRVDKMMETGLEAEARNFYKHRELNSLQTVGYRELFDYFDGDITRDEAVELIKRNSRRYAKRQLTWLRRDDDIVWFDPTDTSTIIDYIESKIVTKP